MIDLIKDHFYSTRVNQRAFLYDVKWDENNPKIRDAKLEVLSLLGDYIYYALIHIYIYAVFLALSLFAPNLR